MRDLRCAKRRGPLTAAPLQVTIQNYPTPQPQQLPAGRIWGAAEAWYPVGGPRLGIDRIRRTVDLEKQARVTLA